MGVLSGYLNTDAEIMQNQREYDAETKRKKEEAIALAANDTRTRNAYDWSISPVNRAFSPTEGGWKLI